MRPSDISYDDHGLIVAGSHVPHSRPRLAFARFLRKHFGNLEERPSGNIGVDGFGYERDEDGVPIRIPHFGSVRLGFGVQIGRGTIIARGTINDTVISDHVKIDCNVFIAHNVTIGPRTLVIAGAVICGSAEIGSDCWIGANSCIKEHTKVGNGAVVGMGAVVIDDVEPNAVVVGNPAKFLRWNK